MNKTEVKSLVAKNITHLDEKKPQTTYKIDYITKYVERWLYVVCNVPENQNINFIDCMCNAGIYSDGDLGTGVRVLELFNEFAPNNLSKEFNLVVNDIDKDRLEIFKAVVALVGVKAKNIHILYNNCDVNNFLLDDNYFYPLFNCYPNRSSNLVFVDPYNFCTVKISALEHFLSKRYCELLFNLFTSDFVRNQDKAKMQQYCKDEKIVAQSKEQMVELLKSRLKTGQIKFSFAYEFKSLTNTELYQIMFFTPNIRGLEKLKEALWITFNGKEFHRNKVKTNTEQLSLFTEEDEKDWMIDYHSEIAQKALLNKFKSQTLDYVDMEIFIIENTILNGNQIIENVIQPLIKEGSIKKLGLVEHKSNYKKDKYQIIG